MSKNKEKENTLNQEENTFNDKISDQVIPENYAGKKNSEFEATDETVDLSPDYTNNSLSMKDSPKNPTPKPKL